MRLNVIFKLIKFKQISQSDPDLRRSCSDKFSSITRASSSSPLEDDHVYPAEMLGVADPILGTTSPETWTHPVPQYSQELELMKTKLVSFQDSTRQDNFLIEKLGAHDLNRPTTILDAEDQATTWLKYTILPKTRNKIAFLWRIGKDAQGRVEKTILESTVFNRFRSDYKILTRNLLIRKIQEPMNTPSTSNAELIVNNDQSNDIVNVDNDFAYDFEGFKNNAAEAADANAINTETLSFPNDASNEEGAKSKQVKKPRTRKQSEYNSQLQKSKDHIKDLKLTELSDKIKQLNIKNAKLEQEQNKVAKQFNSYENKLKSAKEKEIKLVKDKETAIKELAFARQQRDKEIQEKDEELNTSQLRHEMLIQENIALHDRVNQLSNQITESDNQNKSIEDLQTQLANMQQLYTAAQNRCQEKDANILALEQQNADLEEETRGVRVNLDNCNQQITTLKITIVEKETENIALRKNQETNHIERLASMDENINNKEEEIKTLTRETQSKSDEITKLTVLNTQLQKKGKKLKEAYNNMEHSVSAMNAEITE